MTTIEISDTNDIITDINITQLIPSVIDNIVVTMLENFHTIILPLGLNKLMFRNWYKGRGGVFSKDIVKYSQGKTPGNYILIKNANINCIARIILEEEIELFRSLKLIDGQIKDRPYMILKHLEEGETLNGAQKYLNEVSLIHEESEVIYTTIQHEEDNFEHHTGSISLFSE